MKSLVQRLRIQGGNGSNELTEKSSEKDIQYSQRLAGLFCESVCTRDQVEST